MIDEPSMVDDEEPVEGLIDGRGHLRGRQNTADQQARAFADHAQHGLERNRRGAVGAEHLVGRIRNVVAGIDEGTVEVERDEPNHGEWTERTDDWTVMLAQYAVLCSAGLDSAVLVAHLAQS